MKNSMLQARTTQVIELCKKITQLTGKHFKKVSKYYIECVSTYEKIAKQQVDLKVTTFNIQYTKPKTLLYLHRTAFQFLKKKNMKIMKNIETQTNTIWNIQSIPYEPKKRTTETATQCASITTKESSSQIDFVINVTDIQDIRRLAGFGNIEMNVPDTLIKLEPNLTEINKRVVNYIDNRRVTYIDLRPALLLKPDYIEYEGIQIFKKMSDKLKYDCDRLGVTYYPPRSQPPDPYCLIF